ncbi:MFS transporter [Streptomyces cinnamoneus]|uniref:BcmR n=1 Tax=Streptomyces cinnamoneus TaxID=53446 RepID=A0A2G1XAP9_STRCJ|nr:MFS transporter [Streptomyces cinnamoneus]AXQ04971.1 BcmR [Streptomyces cinnamoneus]PHQ48317.1 MFS transporter [Streptomyces cinnamoneus]PPT15949.1 MFS transporter [Streptomyces cinnamoneus]
MLKGPPGQRRALAAVALGVFCIQLDAFALNLALPSIGHDLGASTGSLQWAVSAYLLSTGTLMLGAGRLSDLWGRRRLLVVGLALFGASSLACATAPSLPLLVGARVAQGAGASLIMPVGLALLTNVYPADQRGRATGWALGMGGVATACGPFVGGALTEAASWRVIFWINVPLAVAAAVWASRTPGSRDTAAAPAVDWRGLAFATAALAAVAVFVERGPVWGWTSPRDGLVLAAAAVLLVAFVRHEGRVADPLVNLGLFRNGPFVVLTVAGAVANAATVLFLFVVPLALQGSWGLTAFAAGVAFLAPAAMMAVAGPLAGRVTPGAAVNVMALLLALAGGMLCAAPAIGALPVHLATMTVCGGVLGLANALTLIATQAVIRPERAGEASGVTKTVITVAAGLGVALSGAVADPDGRPASSAAADHALTATGLAALAAGLLLGVWSAARARADRTGRTRPEAGRTRRAMARTGRR